MTEFLFLLFPLFISTSFPVHSWSCSDVYTQFPTYREAETPSWEAGGKAAYLRATHWISSISTIWEFDINVNSPAPP